MADARTANASELGLRERKKQRTRELIAETARDLFTERGFERVTVAQVARAAEVSEQTVFNYFPTKEDLVYRRLESFEEELLTAIRGRGPGQSILAAFRGFVLEPRGLLATKDPRARERLAALTRMITESPALLAREREIFERYTASLAALIADETRAQDADIQPRVVANTLMGVHRALIDYTRQRVVAGARSPRLARDVHAQAEQALALLEQGLGRYGVKDP